ncbi:CD9 antigen-like [Scleropages formosus]|uniref:Tetraspanin 2b n=1 Tax=Scleropages formosus TaxID=113540 RepID=A0A8C9TY25_SCLFO|nr:CD9 antigen-like [Scleropages formosus]
MGGLERFGKILQSLVSANCKQCAARDSLRVHSASFRTNEHAHAVRVQQKGRRVQKSSSAIMGKVQGGMKCVKYLLFIFNFIFWLVGSLVLAVGLWLRFDQKTVWLLNDDAPDTFFIGVYILIGAGGLMMLVGFFGCCGAVRESQCLLGLFFACLVVIFGAEVAAGVFGFLNKEKIIGEIQNFYMETVKENKNNTVIKSFHDVLNCCNASSRDSSSCLSDQSNIEKCKGAIKEFFNGKLYIIGYVGIGIAGVMVIGMIFSMVLCCAIRNSREVI